MRHLAALLLLTILLAYKSEPLQSNGAISTEPESLTCNTEPITKGNHMTPVAPKRGTVRTASTSVSCSVGAVAVLP